MTWDSDEGWKNLNLIYFRKKLANLVLQDMEKKGEIKFKEEKA
jgi:hypothetical protein